MLRIVGGLIFEGKPCPDTYVVTLHELGAGHRELSVRPRIDWGEVGPLHPDSICAQVLRGERDDPDAEDRRRAAKLRNARRAKTRARRVCKVLGLDTLLTLTYRGLQDDLRVCKRHFELFRKRMNNALGGFNFVVFYEPQKRGAWHVHLATRRIPETMVRGGVKLKSYNVIRAIWRDVAGEWGGNVDVSGKQARKGGRRVTQRSPGKIAAYIAKYCTKDFEDWPDGVRRLQTSPCTMSPATRIEVVAQSMADLIALAYAFGADGDCEVLTARVGRFGDWFFLASERPRLDTSIHCRASG